MNVFPYQNELKTLWDRFVSENSVNGTFLHSRRFLEYHGPEKFMDCSVLIGTAKSDIWAVVPACRSLSDGKVTFFSHPGSTYGGIVAEKIRYNLEDMTAIIDALEDYIKSNGFEKAVLKLTPDIFSAASTDLHQYLLTYRGFSHYSELSAYIDYPSYGSDILGHMNNARRRKLKKCLEQNLRFEMISLDKDVAEFYEILKENLEKHGAKPVHTLDELLDFKNGRLPDIVDFYGVFLGDRMIAGAMSFNFRERNVLHIQYSGALQEYNKLTPMSFLFYNLIKSGMERGFSRLSWGISTEKQGKILNLNLAQTKESYGSVFTLNRTFYKEY